MPHPTLTDREALFAATAEALWWLHSLDEHLPVTAPLTDPAVEGYRLGLRWARHKVSHGALLWTTATTTDPITMDTTLWFWNDPQRVTWDMTEAPTTVWQPPGPADARGLKPSGRVIRSAYEEHCVGRRVIGTMLQARNALLAQSDD